MTTTADILPKYRYFSTHSVNQNLIERVLLPGLATQGKFARASRGIELPNTTGQSTQYISLSEASILIISWLETHRNLNDSEVKKLSSIANNLEGSRHAVSTLNILLQNKYREMVTAPETNLTTAVHNNLATYREYQKSQQDDQYSKKGYNPGATIDTYNKTVMEVNKLFQRGYTSHNVITKLLPIDHNNQTPASTQRAIASIISANLDRLAGAGQLHPDSSSLQAHATTRELERIVKHSYPKHADILNYTGDKGFQNRFLKTVNITATAYVGGRGKLNRLDPYRETRLNATQSLPLVVPSMREIEKDLVQTLTHSNISRSEAESLTSTLLREIIITSGQSPDSASIVDSSLAKLGFGRSHRQLIINNINTPKFQLAINYHTQSLDSSTKTHRLNRFDKNLIRRGINPQNTLLTQEELRQYFQTSLSPQPLPENNLDLEQTAWDEYFAELRSDNPDQRHLTSLRNWLDSAHTTFRMDDAELKLASRSRFEHSFTSFASRTRHAQHEFYSKLYKIEENLPWNKGLKKVLEKYDKFAEWAVIPLPFTDKKLPLFRMAPWIMDQWHSLKKTQTTKWLTKLDPSTTRHKLLTHFSKGNFTFSGFTSSASHHFWGNKIAKPMATWANKRFQSGVFKYATKSIGRTGTRLLLKIGGKTLAKFGSKAVLALTSAAGAVTSVVGVAMAIGMVIDLVIMAKDLVKEFLHNANFRHKALGIGAIVTGALAAFQLAPIGLFLGAIGALMLQTLLLSAGVALGLLAFFLVFFNIFTKLPWDIDTPRPDLASSGDFSETAECTPENSPPAYSPGPSQIARIAHDTVADLYQGFWCYWNRPTNPLKSAQYLGKADEPALHPSSHTPSFPDIFDYPQYKANPLPTYTEMSVQGDSLYWCTYLVLHSFRLAGYDIATTLWSPTMQDDFTSRGKFISREKTTRSNVVSGSAIFFKTAGGPDRTNHVGIVNTVDPGGITFYQSNASTKTGSTTFDGAGHLQNISGMAIVGIGTP